MNDVMPSQRDLDAVQEKLAELYATLPPGQQAVLDMILAAGLSMASEDDTAGYSNASITWEEVDVISRRRAIELRETWQRVNRSTTGADRAKRDLRVDLQPLLTWWNRPQAAANA